MTEAQREDLLAIGRATEAQLRHEIRPFVQRDQQEAASRGVVVTAEPPPDLVTALREGGRTGCPAVGGSHGRRWRHHPRRLPPRARGLESRRCGARARDERIGTSS